MCDSDIILFQGFFSRETDFHFYQFLSNFFKYSFSNLPLFYLYNIFAIYFSGNSPFLKSLSSAISNFFYLLISVFNLSSNSAISFVFSKSSLLWQPLVTKTNNHTSNKSLSRISSRDHKRTWQEVSAELLPYLYYYMMVCAINN